MPDLHHPDEAHRSPDCRQMLSRLSDYVDGELDEALCRELELHMAGCENCRIVVDTLRMTVDLVHTAPAPDLPEEVRTRLYVSLRLDPYLKRK